MDRIILRALNLGDQVPAQVDSDEEQEDGQNDHLNDFEEMSGEVDPDNEGENNFPANDNKLSIQQLLNEYRMAKQRNTNTQLTEFLKEITSTDERNKMENMFECSDITQAEEVLTNHKISGISNTEFRRPQALELGLKTVKEMMATKFG